MAAEQRDELERVRAETLRELEEPPRRAGAQIDRLSDHEDQVRTHLVGFFNEQLEMLEGPDFGGTVVGHPARSQAS